MWADSDANHVAAILVSRARQDVLSDELALIDRYFVDGRLSGSTTLSADARSRLTAAAGEYCSAAGWPQLGARYGADALLFADSDALRYRGHAVSVVAHALNGEYGTAGDHLEQAHTLFSRSSWALEETDYLTLLARLLLAPARMNPSELADVASVLEHAQPHNPFWAYTARAARVMQGLLQRDYTSALEAANTLCEGAERSVSHRMVREFVLCIRSDILIATGAPDIALTSLAGAHTRPGHAICFPMKRSDALLHLGRERELLIETEPCIAEGAEHCLRTLIRVKLRRALAHARLRDARRAEQTMTVVLRVLCDTGGSVAPFRMLPRDEVAALLTVVATSHPELTDTTARILQLIDPIAAPPSATPPASPAVGSALFTPAERAIAGLMAEDLTYAEIAHRQGTSISTVKTHARSICRKLGVANRAQAATKLRAERS